MRKCISEENPQVLACREAIAILTALRDFKYQLSTLLGE